MGRHHMPGDGQAHGPNAPTVLVGGARPLPHPVAEHPPGTRAAAALVAVAALFVAFMAGAAAQTAITPAPEPAVEVSAR